MPGNVSGFRRFRCATGMRRQPKLASRRRSLANVCQTVYNFLERIFSAVHLDQRAETRQDERGSRTRLNEQAAPCETGPGIAGDSGRAGRRVGLDGVTHRQWRDPPRLPRDCREGSEARRDLGLSAEPRGPDASAPGEPDRRDAVAEPRQSRHGGHRGFGRDGVALGGLRDDPVRYT